jgi:predicted PurR-regulated permease PerM
MEGNYLDISWKAILKVAFTVALCYLLFLVRQIIIWFVFALIISILLRSVIDFFRHWRLPHWLAVLTTYLLIFGILGGVIYLSLPVIIKEVHQLIVSLPTYLPEFKAFLGNLGIEIPFSSFQEISTRLLQQAPGDILQALGVFFGGLVSTFFVLTMAVFLSFQKQGFGEILAFLSAKRYQKRILKAWKRSRKEVSSWFWMRIIGIAFIAVTYFLTYQLFNIEGALMLGVLSGLLDFIPYFGPLIGALLGGIFAGVQVSWVLGGVIIIILFALQNIESHILSPLVGKKLIGLPPYLILLAITLGAQLFGFLGTILAIPVVAIIYRFIIDFKMGEYERERTEERRIPLE